MLLLIVVFLVTLLVVFGSLALALRPAAAQVALDKRVKEVVTTSSELQSILLPGAESLLAQQRDALGWMRKALVKSPLATQLAALIVRSQVKTTVSAILQMSAGLALLCGIGIFLGLNSPLLAVAAAVAVGYIPFAYLKFRQKKRLNAFNATLPECVETCARSLRAGHSVIASLDIVAQEAPEPAKTEFAEVFKKQNYGLPLNEALLQMMDRMPSEDLRVMVTAFLVQRDTGGNLVDVLERLVVVMRERLRIQRDIRTHTAQGRMTGWILCMLPIGLLVLINLISPGYSAPFFHTDLGRHMLYAGIGLLLLGGYLIRRIIHGIEV
ncbi:type II secretion system F family protein [Silvibacterium sp.]|uniref:type II secretion system F family protein n=1 Tax=Silvibacterium sp. TaxID=1964179 RepID=UPI0039E6EA08